MNRKGHNIYKQQQNLLNCTSKSIVEIHICAYMYDYVFVNNPNDDVVICRKQIAN